MFSRVRYIARLNPISLSARSEALSIPFRFICISQRLTPSASRHLSTAPAAPPLTPPPPSPLPNTDSTFDLTALLSNTGAEYLQTLHTTLSMDSTLFPWSVSIMLSAVTIRLISFPLVYHHQLHHARFSLAMKELPRIQAFVRQTPGSLYQKYLTFRRLRRLALHSAGTSTFKLFRWDLLLHLPIVISASLGIRQLANNAPDVWKHAGLAWFPDLSVADPTGVLPIATTMLWVWNIDSPRTPVALERKVERKSGQPIERVMANRGNWLKGVLQVLSVVSLTVTMDLPAGVLLLWTSNGVVTAVQRSLLSNQRVRQSIGLMTAEEMKMMGGPPILEGTKMAVSKVREELEYVQKAVLRKFPGRIVDENLCGDVNRALKRERWSGRISMDLEAMIRVDDRDGKPYIAVIRKGSEA